MTINYLTLKNMDSQVIIKKKNQLKRHTLICFELWEIEGKRRRGQQRMRWLDGITDSMDMS